MDFKPASVPKKINVALYGVGGAGKTYTSLALATRLCKRVAVIDTDHGSSSLFSREFDFDMAILERYSPEDYLQALRDAEASGHDGVIIDSLSPEWDGPGGCLDLLAQATQNPKVNSYTAWREITPRHDALLAVINHTPLSVFTTLRAKERHEIRTEDGKKQVRALGFGPITRDGFEFEHDLVLSISSSHEVTPTKSRIADLPKGKSVPANDVFFNTVVDFAQGRATVSQKREIYQKAQALGLDLAGLTVDVGRRTGHPYEDLKKLTYRDAQTYLASLGATS